jgi:hypothetical protein
MVRVALVAPAALAMEAVAAVMVEQVAKVRQRLLPIAVEMLSREGQEQLLAPV